MIGRAVAKLMDQGHLVILAPHTYGAVINKQGCYIQVHISSGKYVGRNLWVTTFDHPLHRISVK